MTPTTASAQAKPPGNVNRQTIKRPSVAQLVLRGFRVTVVVIFLGALGVAGTDFGLANWTDRGAEPSLTVSLATAEGSPLDSGKAVLLTIATRHDLGGMLLCVTAIYEFSDDVAATMDEAAEDAVPSVTISGPLVLLYGDAPLSNTPEGFPEGFLWRPQIRIASIDWSAIPPGYPIDTMTLTLPTLHVYRPQIDEQASSGATPSEIKAATETAFAYTGGCFLVEALATSPEGLVQSRYTFRWGDRETEPVVDAKTNETEAEWLFMELPDETITAIEPAPSAFRDGVAKHDFAYNETFQVDVVVGSTRLQSFVTLTYWVAGVLGALILGAAFKFAFGKLGASDPS